MAENKEVAIEKARQYAAAGKFDPAIETLRQALDNSLRDAEVYEAIGDVYVRKKSQKEAIEAYQKAEQLFLKQGSHTETIALYKKLLKLQPDRAELHERGGDLFALQSLKNGAIAEYLAGAKLHLKAGRRLKALSLFRKVSALDPANTSVHVKIAEICLQERRTDEAVEEYLRIGDEYERLKKTEDAQTYYEKALKLSPTHAGARMRLGTAEASETDSGQVAELELETMGQAIAAGDAVPTIEPSAESPPAESELESAALELILDASPGETQAAAAEGTIEFNGLELEVTEKPAVSSGQAAATPAEALRLLVNGDIVQAERMVRTLLLDDPENERYMAILGLIYLQKEEVSAASEILFPIIRTWVDRESG